MEIKQCAQNKKKKRRRRRSNKDQGNKGKEQATVRPTDVEITTLCGGGKSGYYYYYDLILITALRQVWPTPQSTTSTITTIITRDDGDSIQQWFGGWCLLSTHPQSSTSRAKSCLLTGTWFRWFVCWLIQQHSLDDDDPSPPKWRWWLCYCGWVAVVHYMQIIKAIVPIHV